MINHVGPTVRPASGLQKSYLHASRVDPLCYSNSERRTGTAVSFADVPGARRYMIAAPIHIQLHCAHFFVRSLLLRRACWTLRARVSAREHSQPTNAQTKLHRSTCTKPQSHTSHQHANARSFPGTNALSFHPKLPSLCCLLATKMHLLYPCLRRNVTSSRDPDRRDVNQRTWLICRSQSRNAPAPCDIELNMT
jgi:hypothetical protein